MYQCFRLFLGLVILPNTVLHVEQKGRIYILTLQANNGSMSFEILNELSLLSSLTFLDSVRALEFTLIRWRSDFA